MKRAHLRSKSPTLGVQRDLAPATLSRLPVIFKLFLKIPPKTCHQNVGLHDNALELGQHSFGHNNFFADQRIVLVVAVVCIAQFAVRTKIELQKFVPEFSSMSHIISESSV